MGMRAMTDERGVKIWVDNKSQYPRYSFSISKKNDEGKYENFYMEVKFKGGQLKPDNGDEILIKDAFLSFNTWTDKDGHKRTTPYLMVMLWESMENSKGREFLDVPEGIDEAMPFK